MSEDLLAASLLDEQSQITLEDRVRGAIWGQLIGDAFCLGTHWIYDLDELRRAHPDGVRGFETPTADHYHAGKTSGDQTHYGEAALVLLESVADRGELDHRDFGGRFMRYFGAPEHRGYLDHATKETLAHAAAQPAATFDFQHGADDDQLATVSRLAPVVAVACLRGQDRAALLEAVARVTRVTQNNPRAVAYAQADALVLAALLTDHDLHTALLQAERVMASMGTSEAEEVRAQFRAAADATLQTVTAATLAFGQSCPLEHSFPSSVHCLVKHSDSFNDAMIANAEAGGDNAGRAAMLGAWLGARHGLRGIPAAWRERLTAHARIAALTEKLIAGTRADR